VGDDDPIDATPRVASHAVGHRAVEAALGSPEHLGALARGPLGHVGVVAHHRHRERRGSGEDHAGHLAGERGTALDVERGSQAHLGLGEGLHRDEDGATHGHGRRAYSRSMRIRVAVIGAGSWGTTVAHLAAHNVATTLWARSDEVADEIDRSHVNSRYLSGFDLHPALRATSSLAEAVGQADVLVMGVPSHGFRDTLVQVADHLRPWVPVVSLTKGFEQGSGCG
jgi:hypothetical protein